MCVSEELSKCRRNLLIACSVLIIFWLAGAEIKSINAPGMAVNLSRPEVITYFIWLAMLYELIRFKHLYMDAHTSHTLATDKYTIKHDKILKHIRANDPHFMEVQKGYPLIKRSLFKRKIIYIASSEGYQVEKFVDISLFAILALEISIYLKYATTDIQFIEYDLPLLWAAIAIALPTSEAYIAYIRG
jgi:hypothetical protein